MKCWKPSVFLHFHLWTAFREYHFVLRGPIQNEESGISCRRNDHFFTMPGKKMEMPVDLRNSMPKRLRNTFSQLCHMHVGSSSKTELVMETSCLHGIYLPFWARTIGFHFSSICVGAKRNNISYQRNIKLMFAHVNSICKCSNIFHERGIQLVFAHVNNMCRRSNIFYMNETSNLFLRT
jgi:hypothetical protein